MAQNGNFGNTNVLMIASGSTLSDVITGLDVTFATDADVTTLQTAATLTSSSIEAAWTKLAPKYIVTGSCTNDTQAQSAGVPVGGLYHTAGAVKVRLT
jgi:hypothetical protein